MLMLDTSRFPAVREGVRGEFRAVQAELLPNSGERITIAVVIRVGQHWHAMAAPNLESFECVYGTGARVLKEVAHEIVGSLKNASHEAKGQNFNDLLLPLRNLFWSDWERTVTGNSEADAMRAAICQASFLGAFQVNEDNVKALLPKVAPDIVPEKKTSTANSLTKNQVIKQVISGLDSTAPQLASFMRKRRQNAPLDAPDFVGGRAAAEFAVLRHKSIKNDLPDVQASLWRLNAYRGGLRSAVAFVYTDAPIDTGDYGQVLTRMKAQARDRDLQLVPRDSTREIVTELVHLEAA